MADLNSRLLALTLVTNYHCCATQVCGKEDFLRGQLAESLARLGTDYVDLYYMHRMDPDTPIEETMAVLKALVQEGGCSDLGLCLLWHVLLVSCVNCVQCFTPPMQARSGTWACPSAPPASCAAPTPCTR